MGLEWSQSSIHDFSLKNKRKNFLLVFNIISVTDAIKLGQYNDFSFQENVSQILRPQRTLTYVKVKIAHDISLVCYEFL